MYILAKQEPYPAVVMNRGWDIVATNDGAARFFGILLGGRTTGRRQRARLMFHPDGLRPCVMNWEAVAPALVQRLHREAIGGAPDENACKLLAEILDYPGVLRSWRTLDASVAFAARAASFVSTRRAATRFFSAVTVLGTPQDVTLQELRIESFFPVDAATAAAAHRLADEASE